MTVTSHTAIRESLAARITSGEWGLGDRIPDEIDLAREYSCARTTVNRALQALADEGYVIRKRKGGTRVNPSPIRKAKFDIPLLRNQVEATGATYRHQIMERATKIPTASVQTRLRLPGDQDALYIETLHLADERPFAFERRWVNTIVIPEILTAPLEQISANEWLVETVPFSAGDVMFSASAADEKIANALDIASGAAVFTIDRTTWLGDASVTTMKLFYRVGYQLYSKL